MPHRAVPVDVDMHGLDLGTTPAVGAGGAEHDELAHADGRPPDVGDQHAVVCAARDLARASA